MIFKKEKERVLFLLFAQILLAITLFTSCGKHSPEFSTKEDLAKTVIDLLNKGDEKALLKHMVHKDEFINIYYPHFPEANQKPALSGKDFYRTFVGLQRLKAVRTKIKEYGGKSPLLIKTGDPEKIIDTDAFKILRRIPVTFSIKNSAGNKTEITDRDLLGVVIEKDSKYKLLNILD